MTTTEVAEEADLDRRSTCERLERLVDQGRLDAKRVGENGRVWWQPSGAERRTAGERNSSDDPFHTLVDAVDEYAIFMLGPEGHVRTWNSGAERIKGYASDEIVGEHFSKFYTEDDRTAEIPTNNLAEAERYGSAEDEGWRVRSDGSKFWANVTITAIRGDEGALQGYAKVTRDMTDRRDHEALRRHRQQLKRYTEYTDEILDTIDDVFYVLNEDGSLRRWNESFREVTGISDEELESMHISEFFDEDDRAAVAGAIETCVETGTAEVKAELFAADEEWLPYEFVISTLDDPEGNRVLAGIGRDVSAREQRVAELEHRANQQQVVADLGQSALEADDLDELMHEASSRVADVLDNEYCKVLDLDPRAEELLLRQGVGWKDGIAGEATVSAHEDDSQAAYTLANDHPIIVEDLETETRFSGPKLLTDHDVRSGISTVIGPFDEPWGILGTHDTNSKSFSAEDVSFVQSVANVLAEAIERHRYERGFRRTIAELEESNERLEQFAYAASHDLQEPLRMVSSYLQLIERRYEDALDEDGQEFLEFAVNGADRMLAMIDGLLQYSRVETKGKPLESVDLTEVTESVRKDLSVRIAESDAEVTIDELPRVEGDEQQLHRVFQNLLSNAIEYSGDEPPRIHVTADRHKSKWKVSVHDEGVGIEPDDHERIFEIFQRLQSQSDHGGSGIGLALCERIIERHDGDIWVDSESGEGSTFSFTLPAASERVS